MRLYIISETDVAAHAKRERLSLDIARCQLQYKARPWYAHVNTRTETEVMTALCVWEELLRINGVAFGASQPQPEHQALMAYWDDTGAYGMRHVSLEIAAWIDRAYEAMPEGFREDHAFDWELVPTLIALLKWERHADLIQLTPSVAAGITEALITAPIHPEPLASLYVAGCVEEGEEDDRSVSQVPFHDAQFFGVYAHTTIGMTQHLCDLTTYAEAVEVAVFVASRLNLTLGA
jgi:hypothetical protein